MYQLLEDLKEADLEELIPLEDEIEEYLSEYKDYSKKVYDKDYMSNVISFTEFCNIFGIHEDEDISIEEQLDTPLHEI